MGCTALTAIKLPDKLTSLGPNAFGKCSNLTTVDFPSNLSTIGASSFFNCSNLSNVNLPNSLKSIGDDAFKGCTNISSINLPNSLEYIGTGAFTNCSISSITIPASVTTIEGNPFIGCWSLTEINVEGGTNFFVNNGCFYSKDGVVLKGLNVNSIVMPNTITRISQNAFDGCSNISSVVFSDKIEEIESCAFRGCDNLTSAILPNSLKKIGDYAFNSSFVSEFSIPDNMEEIGYGIILGTPYYINSSNWENDLLYIGNNLISSKTNATSFNVKDGTKTIAARTFTSNNNLISLYLPNSVTKIGKNFCGSCSNLKTVVIGNSVDVIPASSFSYCSSLENITIPNSVKSIGEYAFQDCSSLKNIDLPESLEELSSHIFSRCPSLKSLILPANIENIPSSFIDNCSSLKSVTLPRNISNIESLAITDCSNLTEIKCPNPTPPSIISTCFNRLSEDLVIKVPNEAISAYTNDSFWKKFKIEGIATSITIDDALEYTEDISSEYETIIYKRNFETDAWQALYIPFEMKYEDWSDKADVAFINNVHQFDDNNDGKIDRTILEFITKKSGSVEPHTPYMIKPKTTGEMEFCTKNTTLLGAPAENGFVDCMSTTTKYTLYGTYTEKTDMYDCGYYGMFEGNFVKASDSSVTLPPFRVYLNIESRKANNTQQSAPQKIKIMVDGMIEGDASNIEGLQSTMSEEHSPKFNLAGQKVNANYKGIILRNGKKILVK